LQKGVKPRRYLILGILFFFLPFFIPLPLPRQTVIDTDPLFTEDFGEMARITTESFVKSNPNRVAGSEEAKKAALWLSAALKDIGLEPQTQTFGFDWDGVKIGQNIYAIDPGSNLKDEYFLFMAHYDVVPDTIEGANDNGAAVAMVLTFATYFQTHAHNRSIIYAFVDAEEVGLIGSQVFAEKIAKDMNIVAGINFEMVGYKDYSSIYVDSLGFQQGQADAAFVDLIMQSGLRVRVDVETGTTKNWFIDSFSMVIQKAAAFTFSDHGPLNKFAKNVLMVHGSGGSDPHYHTPQDIAENISNVSLLRVGRLVENYFLTIDSLREIPRLCSDYISVGQTSYIPSWFFYFSGALLAFGLVQIVWVKKNSADNPKSPHHPLKQTFVNYIVGFFPLLSTIGVMFLFATLGQIPDPNGVVSVNYLMKNPAYYWALYVSLAIGAGISFLMIAISKFQGRKNKAQTSGDHEIVNISNKTQDQMVVLIFGVFLGFLMLSTHNYLAAFLLSLIGIIQHYFIAEIIEKVLSTPKFIHLGRGIALIPLSALLVAAVILPFLDIRFGDNLLWMLYVGGLYHFPWHAFLGFLLLWIYHPILLFRLFRKKR
jgi:hypothetical protein